MTRIMTGMARAVALVLCLGCAPAGAVDQVLTPDGLGPVRIGMTVQQAEKALGAKLEPRDTASKTSSEACWYTHRTDQPRTTITYKIWYKKVVSIEVYEPEHGDPPPVVTEKGIHIGDADAKAKEAYGKDLEVRTDSQVNEESEASVMTFLSGRKDKGLIFRTTNRKIDELRAGLREAIEIMEGCRY